MFSPTPSPCLSCHFFPLIKANSLKQILKKPQYEGANLSPSPPPRRDGYRGMATFPAQNRECLSCARPKPCTQPLLPCSASMVSMSQGHWMREPRSEYTHTCASGRACTNTSRGARALSPGRRCHIDANAPLIHLKCRRNRYQYFNELVKDRNRAVHFTHTHTHTPRRPHHFA